MSYLHVDFHYELLGISAAILALFALFGMARLTFRRLKRQFGVNFLDHFTS
jgi:hypothetical protein